jgi:transposase
MDGTSLSNGELYTILTNREGHGRKGSLTAVVAGTKSEDVIEVLEKIPGEERSAVREVTLDLSESMNRTVRSCFPKASRVIDRFHVRKPACDAVQEIRIKHRWEAIQQETDCKEKAKGKKEKYIPERFENGDTRKELLAGSCYPLFKSGEKWTDSQRKRSKILFEQYPDMEKAYSLSHSLQMIFNKRSVKDSARLNMTRWYNKAEEAGFHPFNVIAATFYEHSEETVNFLSCPVPYTVQAPRRGLTDSVPTSVLEAILKMLN